MKEEKMFYWALQGPPHHKSESKKSNLSKQSQKLVNLPTEKGSFGRAPHFIKEGQMGGKNSG